MTVGPSGGLLTHSWPPAACNRSARPARPWPLATWGAAGPVVGDGDDELRAVVAGGDQATGGLAVLGHVGQRLRHREVRRLLGQRGQPRRTSRRGAGVERPEVELD